MSIEIQRKEDYLTSTVFPKVTPPRNPKLLKEEPEDVPLLPSTYSQMISMTTKQRLANTHTMRIPQKIELLDMGDTTYQKVSTVSVDEPLFQPYPSEIFFQQYEPFKTYEVPLILKNNDKVPRVIKVQQEDTPYFKIIDPVVASHNVAPGLSITFKIQFIPEENKDYNHEIICISEREKYVVPIKAIGARGVLDFPDDIHFPVCPVKMTSTKTILVTNLGNKEAKFTLETSSPFSVSPAFGDVKIYENCQVNVEFFPKKAGNYQEDLILHYDTGESIFIALYAVAEDVNIRLDKNTIRIESTFISLANQRTVLIHNRSNIIAKYKWSKFATDEEEEQEKNRTLSEIDEEKNIAAEKLKVECSFDPILRTNLSVLNRSFLNRQKVIEDGKGLYIDDVIKIEPVEGEIWPNSSREITVIFKPVEARTYKRAAFCEITGREIRLPLRILGDGKGPEFQFSIGSMDIGPIFIGSCHDYEVVLANNGEVDAVYQVQPKETPFGMSFTFDPPRRCIQPKCYQAIHVSFKSTCLGDFNEIFYFDVEGLPDPLQIQFSGSVIGPTFHFDVTQLNFGTVSYGFLYTKKFKLHNTSLVSMQFRLHVPGDGIVNSIHSSSVEIPPGHTDSNLPPKEFEIIPAKGKIDALTFIEIVVNFVPNSVTEYETVLVVDVINVADQVLSLPIIARCLVPKVVIANPTITFSRCFLFHPYTHHVKLQNISDLPARYDLLKQDPSERSLIAYHSTEPSGILQPFTSFDMPLTIEVKALQELIIPVNFQIFGSSTLITAEMSCFGEGPVVHVTQLELDWGVIPVLTDSSREVTLLNESPIAAHFSAQMSRPASVFRVYPNKGSISAEGKFTLVITANLNDSIRFDDRVKIIFEGSSNQYIFLTAFGEGSTIVADPPLSSILDLGPHFSNHKLSKKFVFSNKGRRHQQVNWVVAPRSSGLFLPKINATGYVNKNQKNGISPTESNTIFQLIPHRFKLMPGEEISVNLIGFIDIPSKVDEELYCYSIIGKQGGKKLLMKVNVRAEFINPLLSFSSTNIVFRVDKTPDIELETQYRDFVLTNIAILPLTVTCTVPEPFSVQYDGQATSEVINGQVISEVTIPIAVQEACRLKILFDPCYKDDLYTRTIDKILKISYLEHPNLDYISLRGEVYMPNLNLEVTELDFGCIMNNSRETKFISILNKSPMPLNFKWSMFGLEQNKITKKLVTQSSRNSRSSEEIFTVSESLQCKLVPLNSPVGWRETTTENDQESNVDEDPSEVTLTGFEMEELLPDEPCQSFILFPMDGTLKPNESDQIKVTFFGHAHMEAHVIAVCEVEGGPTYHLPIRGKASLLSYDFDTKVINYGQQRYDQVAEAAITLTNTSLVGFDFNTINCDNVDERRISPCSPIVVPNFGHIEAGEKQLLTVKYLPGIPEEFFSSFSIQITHFRPEVIKLLGCGTFPHMSLDLPRSDSGDGFYNKVREMAKMNLSKHPDIVHKSGEDDDASKDNSDIVASKDELEKEIDRIAVMLYARGNGNECLYTGDLAKPNFLQDESSSSLGTSRSRRDSEKDKRWKARPRLPSYKLDFGFVVLGVIRTQDVCITNCGYQALSFKMEQNHLAAWGFKVDLGHVKQLPPQETVTFKVTFNPRGADLLLGPVETMILMNIVNGPQVVVNLSAKVTMPDMMVNDSLLEFGDVKCGECKMITVQLYNHRQVPCEWSSIPPETRKDSLISGKENVSTKKSKTKGNSLKNFEMLPSSGILVPEQRLNVQVKFMPTEEKYYEGRILIRLAQSCNRIMLLCKGKGLEQKLIFLEEMNNYGPILPHSAGDEKEVIVKNPCDFPIEFYSVDFDANYLEEEKILRLMRGFDDLNTLLLPPRLAGEKLPPELLEFYKEQKQKIEEMEKIPQDQVPTVLSSVTEDANPEAECRDDSDPEDGDTKADLAESLENLTELTHPGASAKDDASNIDFDDNGDNRNSLYDEIDHEKIKDEVESPGVGELEDTPVSAAIARYMGIDLSPEGQAARNRRGMAIIVHGSPLSGKTELSGELSKMYEAALLTVDEIVIEAIINGTSPASVKAREICAEAAQKKKDEMMMMEEQETVASIPEVSTAPNVPTVNNSIPSAINSIVRKGSTLHPRQAPNQASSPTPTSVLSPKFLTSNNGIQDELLTCPIPEDILVDIIAERLQASDCMKGIIFDGLENFFCNNYANTVQVILKAFNNRRYIYFLCLKLDYSVHKDHERKKEDEEEKKKCKTDANERKWVEKMSEEEYDSMSETQRAKVDKVLAVMKKERMVRESKEREERERKEREAQEAENRRLEDERLLKKKGKKAVDPKTAEKKEEKDSKKNVPQGKTSANTDKLVKLAVNKHELDHRMSMIERSESQYTDRSETLDIEGRNKKKSWMSAKKLVVHEDGREKTDETSRDVSREDVLLMRKFNIFELSLKEINDTLESWDRTTLQLKRPPSPSEKSELEDHPPPSAKKGKVGKSEKSDKQNKESEKEKEREKEKEKEKEREKEKEKERTARETASQMLGNNEGVEIEEGEVDREERENVMVGVPNIFIECIYNDITPILDRVLKTERLPDAVEVLEGLGLGPKGPPIPPPAIFSVVPYPVKRRAPATGELSKHYIFVASSPDDPNIIIEEKPKEPEAEEMPPQDKEKPERATPASKMKGRLPDKQRGSIESIKKKSADKKKGTQQKSQFQVPSPPPGGITPTSEECQSILGENISLTEPKTPKLNYFRWIVPPNSEVTLRILFISNELGHFDQTLTFEITGTRRRYQIFNRGVCAFPSISRDPKIVFPRRKRSKSYVEIVHKRYIHASETFEFGPLLVGNCVDKYKEFQENVEFLTIVNISPMEAEVHFCFLQDNKRETFMLDPPSMILAPEESKKLSVWACPRMAGHFSDAVVCCIKENPETVIFKISCDGFKPELELDKKSFQFDKVLILREEMRCIYLRNRTRLPVAWKLIGTENIGEEFSVSVTSNVVEPLTEYPLMAFFCAKKPVVISKKQIKLEISDVDNIVKPIIEQISIGAEAYDVAVDISFPKGIASDDERRLDFGIVRVSEDAKQALQLKNKGKYDIIYQISPNPELHDKSLLSLFTVTPNKGVLAPLDRPNTANVVFNSDKEIHIKDQNIFQCQVVDPTGGDMLVANLPIKISVRSVYSKFLIVPESDINFGFLMLTTKKTRIITIENRGEFEFKYSIMKMIKEKDLSNKMKRISEQTPGVRLILGMFGIFPASGTVLPGAQQIINVECAADNVGVFDEELSIEITDRDTKHYPHGIPYRIQAECCVPSIATDDIGAIFEEHRICKSLSLWQHLNQVDSGGVYGEAEKKFMFSNVLVGKKSKARFKMINNTKVPCDVNFNLKSPYARGSGKVQHLYEAFEIEPNKAQILNHSHIFVTCTFTPQAMQMYTTTFEAALDSPNALFKMEPMVFEIAGEGTLPRISVTQPTIRNRQGQPVLLFKQSLVGHKQTLKLALTNDASLDCKVDLDLIDADKVFMLVPSDGTNADMGMEVIDDKVIQKKPHTASVSLDCGEQAVFEVTFHPKEPLKSYGQVQLSVHGNQYENTVIWLVGEGYLEEVTLDNIVFDPQLELQLQTQSLDNCQNNENIEATKANLMVFGDCYIGEPKTQCLSITNRCQTDCIHFQWLDEYPLSFSPQVGHLRPGQAKEVTITFNADKPIILKQQVIKCTVKKIIFDQPLNTVPDWDDRIHVIQWVDVELIEATQRADSLSTINVNTVTSNTKEKAVESATRVSSQNKTATSILSVPAVTPTYVGPRKKKVIKTKPQPPCTEIADTERNIALLVSGTADFCEYACSTSQINFKDTLMFQTRTVKLTVINKGIIQMDYNWQIVMDSFKKPVSARGEPKPADEEAPPSPPSSPDLYVPFSTEPEFGTIPPQGNATFIIKFSPLNTTENSGHLICSIPNLKPNAKGLSIRVKGRSLMPYCHFELEDSDYIRIRRNPEMRGPGGSPPGVLDVNTRAIELECVGIGVSLQKKFNILNPTNKAYSYEWISEDETNPKHFTGFTCLTPTGNVRPGRRAEMSFDFKSRELGMAESFWRFMIPEQNISVPFLLVANVKEPDVLLDRSHLRFKPVLINHEVKEIVHLVNNESKAFQFVFDEGSCYSGGIPSKLSIEPMRDFVPPNSRFPITFTFMPLHEKTVNFNIACKVIGKLSPLQMNIKSEGYAMSCAVLCEDMQGVTIELTKWGLNEIDFTEVEINEKTSRILTISNTGKFHFNYELELNEKASQLITVSPKTGGIKFGGKDEILVTFCPKTKVSLNGARIKIKVSNGPVYNIVLTGTGVYPGLHFSFFTHNFGTCFIYKAGMNHKTALLRITNKDTKDISLDCLYTNTNQLMHNFKPDVITPGNFVEVTFSFYPRDAIKYKEIVTFEVNGLSTKTIEFCGKGCEMKVMVVDNKHKIVKFGAQNIGSCTRRTIPIINKSSAPVTLHLQCSLLTPQLREANVFTINPSMDITLPEKVGTMNLQVTFKPTKRIPQFSEEIFLETAGYCQPLFVVQGSCLAMEIDLETNYIPFGAVVIQSYSTRKLVLNNTGDINARVRWDIEKFKPDFLINPVESHVIAGKQIVFDVIFKPQRLLADIRYENLLCFVNEGECPPLKLTLTGTCASTPTSREVLIFQTCVRQKETKNIPIQNRTNQTWDLRPIIDGNYWQGQHKFWVEPQMTKQYEITYKPMCMTGADGKKHNGSIFFPLPDGTALYYSLIGISDPPKPNNKISRDVPCKVHYTELLTVYNWCKQSMRFKAKIDIVKPEKSEMSTVIKGMDYIDVPASGQKDYRVEFHAYKEGATAIKVTFTHTESQEYQFYELTIRSTKPSSLGLIEMISPIRSNTSHTIELENPLYTAVTFNANTNIPDLIVPPQVVIAPQSTRPVKVEFYPIRVGEVSGKLELTSPELGLYLYDVNLRSTPAGPERTIYLRTSLGQSVSHVAKFLNFAKQRTDYLCKVDNTDFHVDKSVAAAPGSASGTEVGVEITFEPSRLGEQRAIMTLVSTVGGEYMFPIFATCTIPKPQGPFVIKAGQTICIVFRNIFNTTTTFTLQVDNELFHLPKKNESIRPHKEARVTIGFDGNDSSSKAEVMAKLIITCPRVTGDTTNAQWVYYLKGVTT